VNSRGKCRIPPNIKIKKAPRSAEEPLLILISGGVRRFERARNCSGAFDWYRVSFVWAPASRIQILDVIGLISLINQEASTDNIALLCPTMQD
jgi:hypothetical protein